MGGNGRLKRKDKIRRASHNDVIKKEAITPKKEEQNGNKKKEKRKEKTSCIITKCVPMGIKEKGTNGNTKNFKKSTIKPPEIKTKNSNNSSDDKSEKMPPYKRKKTEELIAYKATIAQKTKKRNARHARNETPQYDIYTKDLLKQEYEAAFSGDEAMVADGVLSEDEVDDNMYSEKQKQPKMKKSVSTPNGGATPRSFRKRDRNKHDKTAHVTFKDAKKIAMNGKNIKDKKRQKRKQSDDESSGSSDYTGSETESGSSDDSEYTSSSGSDSEYETGSDSEYEDDSDYTSSDDSDSDYSEYTTTDSGDSIKNAAIKHILEDKKSMFSGDDNDDDDENE